MLWQPMHIATFSAPALASPGLASCALAGIPQPIAAASTSVEKSVLFMGTGSRDSVKPSIIGRPLYWSALADTPAHEVPRLGNLCRHARPDAGRECGGDCLLYTSP